MPGLSHNVGLFVAGRKHFEALCKRPPAVAEFLAYGSTREDNPNLVAQWPTDPTILPWHLYVIASFYHKDIKIYENKKRKYHVHLCNIIILHPPINMRDPNNPNTGSINRGGCFARGTPRTKKLNRVFSEVIDRIHNEQYKSIK